MQRQDATGLKSSESPSISETIQKRLKQIWQKAYTAKTHEDLKELYAEWASNYDEDHEAVGFFGHITASNLLKKHLNENNPYILDAGAGTGAAGMALSKIGFDRIVGVDLSEAMLVEAEKKKVYEQLMARDLSVPIDDFKASTFDAAILVGVFSFGQAPASALDEVIRLVKPNGIVVFTMRTDFFESDAMSIRSKMEELVEKKHWRELEVTQPELYLPNKDPNAKFRVWCYRVLESKLPPLDHDFVEALKEEFAKDNHVKELDHKYIWNSTASNLYNRYIQTPEYYLNDCEIEILKDNANDIIGPEELIVELGCGSADKVKWLLKAKHNAADGASLKYIPIDLSPAAVEATHADVDQVFDGKIAVEPIQGTFEAGLDSIPKEQHKLIVFFGSSIGNLETIQETIDFLHMVRETMTPGDRFVVGMDLHKDEEILRAAYEAGDANRRFFLNMVRRMNDELGADFDLSKFVQDSSYDEDESFKGIRNRCVNFKLVTKVEQTTEIDPVDEEFVLKSGGAIQVGRSRKYEKEDIAKLAKEAGFELQRQWIDSRGFFSLNELVPANGQPSS